MLYTTLTISVENRVGYLLLDSGARFNTLSLETLRELANAFAVLEADPQVSVILISGYPGESFAVGANIAEMVDFTPADAFRFAEVGQALFEQIEDAQKPVVAALNGITMGGGCDLSLACDLRLASSTIRFAHPGARLGILTGFCGTQKLPRLVGRNRALEVFMTSHTFDAEEGERIGYLNRVYPADTFWSEVRRFAEAMAAFPAEALGAVKQLANRAEEVDLKSGCLMERNWYLALKERADARQAGKMS